MGLFFFWGGGDSEQNRVLCFSSVFSYNDEFGILCVTPSGSMTGPHGPLGASWLWSETSWTGSGPAESKTGCQLPSTCWDRFMHWPGAFIGMKSEEDLYFSICSLSDWQDTCNSVFCSLSGTFTASYGAFRACLQQWRPGLPALCLGRGSSELTPGQPG